MRHICCKYQAIRGKPIKLKIHTIFLHLKRASDKIHLHYRDYHSIAHKRDKDEDNIGW